MKAYYNPDDAAVRSATRSADAAARSIPVAAATFAYDHSIKTGIAKAQVHKTLSPKGVTVRESRDSDKMPVAVPIIVGTDTTGSMKTVPTMLQAALTRLMGCFLNDKASGKKYLGDGYPAIMIAAVDDFAAQKSRGLTDGDGCLQVGQFESGIEIDDNLTNLWMTDNGGGTYHESYELLAYFAARHTVHDHMEKRGRKGYLFFIGDEHAYPMVSKDQVKAVIGETIQADIPLEQILEEAQQKYHVFFVIPNMTSYYKEETLFEYWVKLLGQQNVLRLEDPTKICELIAGAVAICEEHVGVDDIAADLGMGSSVSALVPLSKAGVVASYASGGGLVPSSAAAVERL